MATTKSAKHSPKTIIADKVTWLIFIKTNIEFGQIIYDQ